jgi:hypothetical protein
LLIFNEEKIKKPKEKAITFKSKRKYVKTLTGNNPNGLKTEINRSKFQ